MTASTKMALVPPIAGYEIFQHGRYLDYQRGPEDIAEGDRKAGITSRPLYASPSSGRLTAADLERAAEAHFEARSECMMLGLKWSGVSDNGKQRALIAMRAAFAAIGLPVEGEQG